MGDQAKKNCQRPKHQNEKENSDEEQMQMPKSKMTQIKN
jgi:hypothetical protein